ncbi:MAG: cytochrome oxidase [Gemmatimonadetes bacterium]|jgi:cytochrome c oxidase subunit 3|nr:cytochrome oxidase [Gemmatimonadota bacterium]
MRLLLLSLGILFAAALVGYLIIRLRAGQWPPPGSPELPGGLWVSTAILVVLSAVLVMAVGRARAGRASETARLLAAATALGAAFLVAQAANWLRLGGSGERTMLVFGFWLLTVLHALHVLGGLIPLAITTARAARGRYLNDPEPVELVSSYWHFLGVTWLAIFAALSL